MTSTMHKLRIGILFGGRSSEHKVSLASAMSVITSLDKEKYEITLIGITRNGRWIVGTTPGQLLQQEQEASKQDHTFSTAYLTTGSSQLPISYDFPPFLSEKLDVIFPVLHGTYGEDGSIQGLLEMANIPYVGCGVLSSALGMDKDKMKLLLRAVGLPTIEAFVCRRSELRRSSEQLMDTIEHQVGYPCFVKPANGGSSIGISKVYNHAELAPALQLAARYDAKLVVEQAICCRELSCAVIGNEDPIASVVGEVTVAHDFYDYHAKYLDNTSYTTVPAEISRELSNEIRFQAIQAFRALDLCGLARVDFFLDTETGQILINEVNTFPSFTKQCLYPKLCETIGLPYPLLLEYLIDLALERHADRQNNDTSVQFSTMQAELTSQSITAQSVKKFTGLLPEQHVHVDLGFEQQLTYQHLPC
ncbi:MAG: D-alanine--D-alanine ligase family protein [Ktedonobacteraceae bacterium]